MPHKRSDKQLFIITDPGLNVAANSTVSSNDYEAFITSNFCNYTVAEQKFLHLSS